jgi:hypothetical protein
VAAEEPVSANVEALRRLIDEYPFLSNSWASDLAVFLASRGVLATEALTDEQCEDLWSDGTEYDYDYGKQYEAKAFRAALARLARGEP